MASYPPLPTPMYVIGKPRPVHVCSEDILSKDTCNEAACPADLDLFFAKHYACMYAW